MSVGIIVSGILTLLFGIGGGGGIMYWLLEKRNQDHEQELDLLDRFEKRLNSVENKYSELEEKYQQVKKRNNRLVYQINIMLKRIKLLIERLDKYEELDEKEKVQFQEIPEFNESLNGN